MTGRFFKVVLCWVWVLHCAGAMHAHPKDSLAARDYQYLLDRISNSGNNIKLQQMYLEAFLNNAKSAKDWQHLEKAYRNYVNYTSGELKIQYADSMVFAAQKNYDDKLIGSAFLTRGIAYYGSKRHTEALQDYIAARPYLERVGNDYLLFKLKYNIAHERYYLGQTEKALTLFNECLDYFK